MSVSKRQIAVFGGILVLGAGMVWALSSAMESQERQDRALVLIEEGERLLVQEGGGRDAIVQALRRGEEALRLLPGEARAQRILARAHGKLGDRIRAVEFFDLYLQAVQDDAEALVEGGIAYRERWELSRDLDHKAQAETYLRRALSLLPRDPRIQSELDRLQR